MEEYFFGLSCESGFIRQVVYGIGFFAGWIFGLVPGIRIFNGGPLRRVGGAWLRRVAGNSTAGCRRWSVVVRTFNRINFTVSKRYHYRAFDPFHLNLYGYAVFSKLGFFSHAG